MIKPSIQPDGFFVFKICAKFDHQSINRVQLTTKTSFKRIDIVRKREYKEVLSVKRLFK